MKSLIIVSHPAIDSSNTQAFLKASLPTGVTWHAIDTSYPDGKINVQAEQQLLREHDRIIFQFPFYWYSAPALLKQWQDVVLTTDFAHGANGSALVGKEFRLVISSGVDEEAYQAGGSEGFTFSELTRPFQAMAQKCQMTYLSPLIISRFDYLSESQQKKLLIEYQQFLTMPADGRFSTKTTWFLTELARLSEATSGDEQQNLELITNQIITNQETIEELSLTLKMMKDGTV